MEFPDDRERRLTEEIMAAIREHVKQEEPPQENHHFNRVYEKVYRVLRELR